MGFSTFNLFIYLTAINTIESNNNKVISLPFLKGDSLVIEFSMGSRWSSNHLVLNQNIDYLWTIAHFWKISESSSANQLQNTTIDHVSGSFEGIIVEDIFYFKEEFKYIQLAFKYSKNLKIIPFNSGKLGLPFKFQNKTYSLVHILKESNLINNLSYSITFYHNRDTYNDYNKFQGNIYIFRRNT